MGSDGHQPPQKITLGEMREAGVRHGAIAGLSLRAFHQGLR
jgi:hypothetical protein